jgi:SAM-dependent methyltransferase
MDQRDEQPGCMGSRSHIHAHRAWIVERVSVITTQTITPAEVATRRVLSVGSGPDNAAEASWTAKWELEGYQVIRLDIDSRNKPHICASMTDMGDVGTHEVVYCCHALEHLYPHEVPKALSEFYRVLSSGGVAVIMVPDLEDVRPTEDILDIPTMGPVTGLHLFYGDASQIEQYPFMAHHCGFVRQTLEKAMLRAGFVDVNVKRAAEYNLIATGRKA